MGLSHKSKYAQPLRT